MIYFIQAEQGGPVKIGYTTGETIAARLSSLQTSCPFPLRVLRTMPGTTQDERALHARFADARLHGEWFHPTDELIALAGDVNRSPLELHGHRIVSARRFYGPLVRYRQEIRDALDDDPVRCSVIRSRLPSPCTPAVATATLIWLREHDMAKSYRWRGGYGYDDPPCLLWSAP